MGGLDPCAEGGGERRSGSPVARGPGPPTRPRSLRNDTESLAEPYFASFMTVPPFSVHSFSVFTFVQPLPLHSFLPAQAWLPSAAAHSPLPLHELTPEHFTVLPESFFPSAANW